MAQSNCKIPLALGPETGYETWKSEIAVWRLVTDLEKKHQALAVTLSLCGQARAMALEIDVGQLNADDCMDVLLAALDSLFQKVYVHVRFHCGV